MELLKRLLCVLIIIGTVCTIGISALAEAKGSIDDAILPIDNNVSFDFSSVQPDTEYIFPLTADMFDWSGGAGAEGDPVTRAQIRSANISIKHTLNKTEVLKDISLTTTTYNDSETMAVKVEFAEEFVSVNSLDFHLTIYLSKGSSKLSDSSVTINGTFENEEIEIDSSDDYVSLSKGQVLSSNGYIAELEIDMGDGVQLYTRIQSDRKYYAKAKDAILDEDDSMLSKYPAIQTAIHLYTVNVSTTGNCVLLSSVGDYHVYNKSGTYLGTTAERLPFYEVYYLTEAQISMSGGGSSSSGSSGDSDSSSSSTGIISGNTAEEQAAQDEMANAAAEAAASGSDTADMTMQNVEKISTGELQAMFDAASAAKMKAKLSVNTTNTPGDVIEGTITINPAMAVNLEGDIMLGVHTSSYYTFDVAEKFTDQFANEIRVVYLTHEGSYGMKVSIAARVNLEQMDRSNLYFYIYDSESNKYNSLANPAFYLNGNGYVCFDTIYGGHVVISEGPLTKKPEDPKEDDGEVSLW